MFSKKNDCLTNLIHRIKCDHYNSVSSRTICFLDENVIVRLVLVLSNVTDRCKTIIVRFRTWKIMTVRIVLFVEKCEC